jgi:hypothetical protein
MASSNVGSSQIYEDGDQKNIPRSEIDQMKKDNRFHEGKENSHLPNDSSKIGSIPAQQHLDFNSLHQRMSDRLQTS